MKETNQFFIFFFVILTAAISRLAPHPPNFAPLTAIAIAGSTALGFRRGAVLSLLAIWMSDFMVNNILYAHYFPGVVWFYEGWYWQYGGWLVIALMASQTLRKISIVNWLLTTFSATLIFFLISNLGVWADSPLYEKSLSGLYLAYLAGLPFLKNTFLSDLVYSGVLLSLNLLALRKLKKALQVN